MKYTKYELETFKRVIRDYNILKQDIDNKINNGYTMETLLDYIRHLSSCNITNYCLIEDFKYIDFNYCDMNVSILEHNNKVYLAETIEVWNDKELYYVGIFSTTKELEKILMEV